MSTIAVTAEVVAVGSELLLGDHVDTNSAWISGRLAEIGVDVHRHTTVGDNVARMVAVIARACERADVVLVTGGLGPTQDDLTREAVARVAGVELVRNGALVDHIAGLFAARGRPMPANNLRQADLPAGARILAPVGTAAGFALDVRSPSARLYCLPGVPREMTEMVERDVLPELRELAGAGTTVSRLVRTSGMSESGVAELLADLVDELDGTGNPTLAFLASRGETRVRVTAKARTRAEALALADPVVERVVERLGAGVAGVDDQGAEHAVAGMLLAMGLTLAVGESVTGGGLGSRLVSVPGASGWFRGGLIAYADAGKRALGIDAGLLARHGSVSEPVAGSLAELAAERLGADVGLALVGAAGPTAPEGVAVGTICLGWLGPDGATRTRSVSLPSRSRADVQEFAASVALDLARRQLARLGG